MLLAVAGLLYVHQMISSHGSDEAVTLLQNSVARRSPVLVPLGAGAPTPPLYGHSIRAGMTKALHSHSCENAICLYMNCLNTL